MRYLKGKVKLRGAQPKLFDECVYSPYSYGKAVSENGKRAASDSYESRREHSRERRFSDSAVVVENSNEQRRENLMDLGASNAETSSDPEASAMQLAGADNAEAAMGGPDADGSLQNP